ncbi:membrane-bound metal-dependent hydrolase [Methanocaldococcus villosus KIN24-T80]|uniref:Membrane-bound metal-dependent hydrolase n=1 Tax=Methanocaldococcus villosus KIN24-T80 TaxID=1069083 RepID=N6VPC0_9EURY|nr:metal-dependent hydrolase [Methanocaldococcus villosus]ENN95725.1 membrane-bound metal-dependent hydrolase [Methanocaldococcus villosus KIN24-T80]
MDWKGHTILGLVFGLPFISSPEQIFLALAGALYPDLDHDVKEDIVKRGIYISLGLVLINILIYYFKKEYFNLDLFILSVSVLLIYLIPYFANHRGITHTFWTLILVSVILGFLALKLTIFSPVLAGIIVLLMVVNEKLLGKILIIAIFGWIVLDILKPHSLVSGNLSYILPVAVGYLSHIVGDSITPAGVKAFYPISKYKLRKKEGYILILVWFLMVLYIWKDIILSLLIFK